MSDRGQLGVAVLRPLILAVTALLIWVTMWIGQQSESLVLEVGDLAPQSFSTEFALDPIPDDAATQLRREAAASEVEEMYAIDETAADAVIAQIREVFADAQAIPFQTDGPSLEDVAAAVPTTTIPEDPEPTTTTVAPEAEEGATGGEEGEQAPDATTTTTIPRTADVTGTVYIDVDDDDSYLDSADSEIPDIEVVLVDADGDLHRGSTSTRGVFVIRDLPAGPATLVVDAATVPDALTADLDDLTVEFELVPNDIVELPPIQFEAQVRPADIQRTELEELHGSLGPDSVDLLVEFATGDVVRSAADQSQWLSVLEVRTIERAQDAMTRPDGIKVEELEDVKDVVREDISLVQLPFATSDENARASTAASEVAAEFLVPNSAVDVSQTEAAREDARNAVEAATVEFDAGDEIVGQGEVITAVQLEALRAAGFFQPPQVELFSLAAVVALLVIVLAVYLARFRPRVWSQMRRMALMGLLLVMAAVAARGIAVFAADSPEVGYLMPAAAIGLMAAILFDARIAVLMSVAVGVLTAIATGDPGFTVFAALATIVPVPWVSSISARGELRSAVVYTTIGLAVMAAVLAWFFQGERFVATAAAYGAVNGILSGLVGTAALSFVEITFDLTTNLRLLDLTDRNHPALRLLEEEAIGTFNHSLMVGTLADRAARAVDANNLLARAAAYYHDLGKTENPQFFIENQFGSTNPHDALPPDESAAIIRQHVTDGKKLARRFRIPSDVVEGVVTHHGDGVMRFFYHKALERYGEEHVDIDDYRHAGHKPQSKEMAVVMMADSVEGACRAIFEKEDPSPQRIAEVVERVVGEKVSDGQLSESELTLGDLTRAKAAMVEALKGHYHQRIPYPNFPDAGSDGNSGAFDDELDDDDDEAERASEPRVERSPTE